MSFRFDNAIVLNYKSPGLILFGHLGSLAKVFAGVRARYGIGDMNRISEGLMSFLRAHFFKNLRPDADGSGEVGGRTIIETAIYFECLGRLSCWVPHNDLGLTFAG